MRYVVHSVFYSKARTQRKKNLKKFSFFLNESVYVSLLQNELCVDDRFDYICRQVY
jgi:hypothetical protein